MSMAADHPRRLVAEESGRDAPGMDLIRRLRAAVSTPDRAPSGRARRTAGYDASRDQTLARIEPMLTAEPTVWLSTVRPDGLPHIVPTWFWWDGDAVVVFSKPNAVKVRNLRANPRLMFALGRPDEDFSVGLIEAEATLVSGRADIPDAFFVKYADQLRDGGLDPATFRETYTQAIRIAPTRFLAWRGRGVRHERPARPQPSVRAAAAERPARGLPAPGTLLPAWA